MTGIKMLCTNFEITLNSVDTRLNRDLLARQEGFVLENSHVIVQRNFREFSIIDSAKCIDNYVRDDSLMRR